eukprot:744378_1
MEFVCMALYGQLQCICRIMTTIVYIYLLFSTKSFREYRSLLMIATTIPHEAENDDHDPLIPIHSSIEMIEITIPHEAEIDDHEPLADASFRRNVERRLSFRQAIDNSRENRIVFMAAILSVIIILVCIILSWTDPDSFVFDFMFLPKAMLLVFAESLWLMCMSYLAIRYDMKINYTRKLARLPSIPKYFLVDYLPAVPGFKNNESTTLLIFATSQLLYILMFHRTMRNKFYLLQFIFIACNRVEDQPYTLQFSLTEDFMRFFCVLSSHTMGRIQE